MLHAFLHGIQTISLEQISASLPLGRQDPGLIFDQLFSKNWKLYDQGKYTNFADKRNGRTEHLP